MFFNNVIFVTPYSVLSVHILPKQRHLYSENWILARSSTSKFFKITLTIYLLYYFNLNSGIFILNYFFSVTIMPNIIKSITGKQMILKTRSRPNPEKFVFKSSWKHIDSDPTTDPTSVYQGMQTVDAEMGICWNVRVNRGLALMILVVFFPLKNT